MKKLKKLLRLVLYILLIVLASLGVGLAGGAVQLPSQRKKNDRQEVNVELKDEKKKDARPVKRREVG